MTVWQSTPPHPVLLNLPTAAFLTHNLSSLAEPLPATRGQSLSGWHTKQVASSSLGHCGQFKVSNSSHMHDACYWTVSGIENPERTHAPKQIQTLLRISPGRESNPQPFLEFRYTFFCDFFFFLTLQLSTLHIDAEDIKWLVKIYVIMQQNTFINHKCFFYERWLFWIIEENYNANKPANVYL